MAASGRTMRLPAGVRDWLPHELARKREIEQQLRAVFGRWAYEEVQTPIIERFDVLERGLGEETTELLFQFNDRRSTALALRPEMTTPIARLVSTRHARGAAAAAARRTSRRCSATTSSRRKAACAS